MRQRESKKADLIFSLLAKELKTEREKQQKSIRLLAYEFDIQKSLISRLENGINEPKLISLWTLCEAVNIKHSELLKRGEEDLPEDFSLIEK